MGELFDHFEVEPIIGKDITIGDRFPEVFVSETDEVFCYLGICLKDDEHRNRVSFMRHHYMRGKHSADKAISEEIKGFYRLIDGCIILDNYVDVEYHNKHRYKKIDVGIRLATPGSCYYGVLKSYDEEYSELTRKIFGLTYDEITALLEAYAKMMGTYREFYTYPKLTRSIRNTNFCDMTELWIPETFPYVAFSDSGYDFSHVSLFGFYRHIQLLTGYKTNSLISQALMKSGLTEKVLKTVFDIGQGFFHQTKITRDVLWG